MTLKNRAVRALLIAAIVALGVPAHAADDAKASRLKDVDPAVAKVRATVRELARIADAWDKAIVRKDISAIANTMRDDFRQIRENGSVVDGKTFLDDIAAPQLTIDPYTVEDFDVRVYGDVALLSGRTNMTGSYDGQPFSAHYRYIDVYVKTGTRWKVASVQISPILRKEK